MALSISKIRDVAHLVYGKREMPVFGIVHDEVLVGIVVRMVRMCFKLLSKLFPLRMK